ncbi:hypothetical protein [Gracilimonas mengyeensis]|uniref:Lipoprotein n=1 Tax=Gracilimonas mengyeensis TaxID=1302730 RepID=A0A521BWP8_9BACT|nr:hypothetical protein [Gracilimonas mengyeensis]SMO51613.1 hypothetical protein SAMN06265219_103169 [Gracilimonas mengyeensis]
MLQKLLLILCVFSLYSCRASKTFINPEKEESIQMLNEKMQGKTMLIFKQEADSSFRAKGVRVSSDSIYYGTDSMQVLSLSDVSYLKNTYQVNKVALVAGLGLVTAGIFAQKQSNHEESFGAALGKTIEGMMYGTLGLGFTVGGLINRSRYFYFSDDVDVKADESEEKACISPRCKRGY